MPSPLYQIIGMNQYLWVATNKILLLYIMKAEAAFYKFKNSKDVLQMNKQTIKT